MRIIKRCEILIKKGNIYDLYKDGKLYASNKPTNKVLVLNIEAFKLLNDGIYNVQIIEKTKKININNPILGDDADYEIYIPANESDIINIK